MTTRASSSSWDAGVTWVSPEVVNWFARRRIAISLIGFTSLVVFNILIVRTVPYNPLHITQTPVAVALLCLLIGLGIRSWSAGTLNKSRELTTCGPYALVRNPLYVGSFLMMFGFCLLCRDWPTLLFVAGPMSALYWLQVRFEERRLSQLFPEQWPGYVRSVPRFIPTRWQPTVIGGWTVREWLRNREYQAVAASVVGVVGVYGWYLIAAA